MPHIDAHLPIARVDDRDLDNLVYFGLKSAILVIADSVRMHEPADVIPAIERHVSRERERSEAAGLQPKVAVGITPSLAPERAFPAYFARLRQLCARGKVDVIGPIGWKYGDPWESELFLRQLRIAEEFGLPVYVRWSAFDERIEREMDRVLDEVDIPREDLWFINVPPDRAKLLAITRRPFVVSVPPRGVDAKVIAEALELAQTGEVPVRFGSSLDVADVGVTAIARLHSDLEAMGVQLVAEPPGVMRP